MKRQSDLSPFSAVVWFGGRAVLGHDRYGRDALLDALPRDPAWHVSKLVSGFSHGRPCVYREWHLFETCHAGSRGSASAERVPTIEESRFVTSSLYSYGWNSWIIGFAL